MGYPDCYNEADHRRALAALINDMGLSTVGADDAGPLRADGSRRRGQFVEPADSGTIVVTDGGESATVQGLRLVRS